MTRIALALTACLVALPGRAMAQDTPDIARFLGSWRMDMARSETAADPDTPLENVVVDIAKTNAQLHIHTVRNEVETFSRYPLQPSSANEPLDYKIGRLEWNGRVLITYSSVYINGMALVILEKRSISADTNDMTVDTLVTVQHGYQGGVNYSSPIRDIYTRQSP